MTKTIALLGATGSIGRQTLEVARELGISVAALTANRQVDLLEQQARQFRRRRVEGKTGDNQVSQQIPTQTG